MHFRLVSRWMRIWLVFLALFLGGLVRIDQAKADAPVISNITIDPALDISLFDGYTVNATISNYPTSESANLNLRTINGDGGDDWNFYADGTADPQTIDLSMTYLSGSVWQKNHIYPDYITSYF